MLGIEPKQLGPEASVPTIVLSLGMLGRGGAGGPRATDSNPCPETSIPSLLLITNQNFGHLLEVSGKLLRFLSDHL